MVILVEESPMAEKDYEKFTGPARLDRDMHILEGLLQGVALDGSVNPKEAAALLSWCPSSSTYSHRGTS